MYLFSLAVVSDNVLYYTQSKARILAQKFKTCNFFIISFTVIHSNWEHNILFPGSEHQQNPSPKSLRTFAAVTSCEDTKKVPIIVISSVKSLVLSHITALSLGIVIGIVLKYSL